MKSIEIYEEVLQDKPMSLDDKLGSLWVGISNVGNVVKILKVVKI